MTERPTCPECGKPLDPSSPEGLCPACLMEQGLAERGSTVDDSDDATRTDPAQPGDPQAKQPRRIGQYYLVK